MFGISGTELLIILFFGFLIFGPDKLPQIGRTVGRAIKQFRDASEAANKKFKEQVADPFQEAIAPYKDQMEESTKPIQDDINAINQTFNETKSMFTDPFKGIFTNEPKPAASPKGAVIGGVAADVPAAKADASEGVTTSTGEAASAAEGGIPDPFAGVIDGGGSTAADSGEAVASRDESTSAQGDSSNAEPAASDSSQKPEGKPLPQTGGKVKKSMAASLYGLDDAKDGE